MVRAPQTLLNGGSAKLLLLLVREVRCCVARSPVPCQLLLSACVLLATAVNLLLLMLVKDAVLELLLWVTFVACSMHVAHRGRQRRWAASVPLGRSVGERRWSDQALVARTWPLHGVRANELMVQALPCVSADG